AKTFNLAIQTGAMLAVVWEYRAKFGGVLAGLASDRASQRFVTNLAVAFLPAAVLGLAFAGAIKQHLFHAVPVAAAFILGGIIILWVEHSPRRITVEQVDDMTWKDALKVGLAQSFALIPGMSRSGATIIGGMLFGLSRRAATEFSFFLAVPTLIAAGAYDLYKHRALLDAGDLGVFVAGFIVSFVSAFLCVRWLLRYIATHDFSAFAWYRIAFGIAVLATGYTGLVNWAA
ncbi:MAG: undecaprenyl-diphosphate phosphatase, partial [Burkholderiales bacterium]